MNPTTHRVFAAVLLPPETKERVRRALAGIPRAAGGNFRFLSEEHWHITLSFLGYQGNDAVAAIAEAAQAAAAVSRSFTVAFEEIVYGPPGASPRMIWVCGAGAAARALGILAGRFEDELARRGVAFKRERRPFALHVTLARLARLLPSPLPELRVPCLVSFTISGIDLMESYLKRSGAEYASLAHFDFPAG